MEARGSAGGGRPVKGILKNRSGSGAGSAGRSLADSEALPQASPLPPAGPLLQAQPSTESRGEEQGKKTQKWDEMNILATYHPPGKDYGLMKIDEPSTPYHSLKEEDAGSDAEDSPVPTADILAKKNGLDTDNQCPHCKNGLRSISIAVAFPNKSLGAIFVKGEKLAAAAQGQGPKILARQDDSSDEEEEDDEGDLTPEELEKKRQFEMKRKMHYNEAQNIKLARQLIAKEMHGEAADEEEDCEEDEEEDEDNEDDMQDECKTDTESVPAPSDPLENIAHSLEEVCSGL